ncbi:ParB/RepB/Spo0J family partition protein [Roseibium aggregatum]|uniref:Putative chromosome-partitioning protein ParB n=1 Tax=Roseibium aggregatum TaxID=187304 RepID=A0A0M6YEZ1_9HYPH|nr:ParB/RepB/Spo0J family partition protein [Roseibium aggregatum]CTQ47581.1 putative chromosome-partitioning protein ParB [Roseibium aggregatum]
MTKTKATTNEIKVPFKELALDPKNVRKKVDLNGIQSLAANIAVNGVLQNLIVRPAEKRGHYLVTGGGRRYRAVEHLINEGTFTADYELSCQVRTEAEATELSLAENVMREAMDASAEFRAFKTLADDGKTAAEIATRFGTTELIVTKRLKLARVSPVLFELFEQGDMELSQLQAFTVSDDHEAQERVWNALPPYYRNGQDIRRALTDGKIAASDKRIKFLGGLDAVREAGGTVICDLFSDRDGGYVEDAALVEKLVAEKIDAVSIKIAAEGWKWIRYQAEMDYSAMQSFGREYPKQPEFSDEDQAELERLEKAGDEAAARYNESGDEEDRLAYEAADQAIEDLQARYAPEFSDEQKAVCGTILSIGYQGDLRIERGLIDPADQKAKAAACVTGSEEVAETATHSKALIAELTARKTAVLRMELAKYPDIALAVAVHSMAIKTLYDFGAARDNGTVEISLDSSCLESQIKDAGQCDVLNALERQRESWKSVLQLDPVDLWDWCLDVSQKTLLDLQAFCVAQTVNAIDHGEGYNKTGIDHGDRIGTALGTDITAHFQPTAGNYFSRVKLDIIHASLVEACGEEAAAPVRKMKKKEAAAYADDKVAGTGWVPSLMTFVDESPVLEEGINEAA